jgi:hypothetical protein
VKSPPVARQDPAMTDEIDKLLAKVKSEYDPSGPPATPESTPTPPKQEAKAASTPQNTGSIDNLLAQIEVEGKTSGRAPTGWQGSPSQSRSPQGSGSFDELLTGVKEEFEGRDRLEREEHERAERERAEEERRRREQQRQKVAKKAQEWLKQLDPYSDEGFWFGQFAEGYASRLEAAIDYLEALEQKSE